MAVQTAANMRLAAPRSLLDRYMREAAEAVASQRVELGKRIAQARTDKGWKQKQLAAAVHVEPTTVSRWETGRHAPDLDVLDAIAHATDKPLAYFVNAPSPNGSTGEERWQRDLQDEIRRGFQQVNAKLDKLAEEQRRSSVRSSS